MIRRTLLAVAFFATVARAQVVQIEDFETGGARWAAARGDLARSAGSARAGAAGGAWRAEAGARIARRDVPADWRTFRAIRVSLRPGPGPDLAAQRVFRLVVRERGDRHAWIRRIHLATGSWTDVELPLWQFRHVGAPRWTEVEAFEIQSDQAGPVDVDEIGLVPGDAGTSSWGLPDEIALASAFPDRPWTRSASRRGPFRVLSEVPGADAGAILAGMETVYADFRTLFGIEEPPPEAPFDLYLFDAADRYRRLLPHLVESFFAVQLAPPESDGISVLYLAASSHEPKFPGGRPVLFHEATHSFLAWHLRVPSEGGWLQEGVATLLQNRNIRQADLDEQVRTMLQPANRLSLEQLFSAERLRPGPAYLQAMTVVEFLLDPDRAGMRERLVAGWREGRSVPDVLGVPVGELEADWLEWCNERYGGE